MSAKHQITWRADAGTACPVCGSGTKGCSGMDNAAINCRGEPADPAKWVLVADTDHSGFRVWKPADLPPPGKRGRKPTAPSSSSTSTSPPPPTASAIDWTLRAKTYAETLARPSHNPYLADLAASLRLPIDALAALPLLGWYGMTTEGHTFTFPEVDATGVVIGINRRFPDNSKKAEHDSRRGLTLPLLWRERPGPLFVVEGASDTLALTHAGVCCVGRPSNLGGGDLLAELLRDWPADRGIVVVGENDEKPNGDWPGRVGAESTAAKLSAALNRRIEVAFPPLPFKDVRAFLTDESLAATPWPDRGSLITTKMMAAAFPAVPAVVTEDITQWDRDPDNPHRLARAYLAATYPAADGLKRLRYWREEFHEWRGGCYHTLREGNLNGRVNAWLDTEFRRVRVLELEAWKNRGGSDSGPAPRVRDVTRALIGNVIAALQGECLLESDTPTPAWVDGTAGPDPKHLVAVRNGLYDLRTDTLHPPSPSFFSLAVAPFEYDPAAPPPAEWLKFLNTLWPDDPDSIACLQEWFGYLLTPDTAQQKLLFLLGPKRAGKGTIARVLKGLVGDHGFSGPTLSGLGGEYGLWPLLGKSVALISDARLSGRTDTAAVVERILSITGEDTITVNRKNLALIDTRLTARFVILSNELPNLTDASGALPGRMILLRLTRTFYGDEDTGLIDRLLRELPAVLNWAIQGYHRLTRRGKFVQPASSRQVMREMEDIGSPVSAFVRQRCRLAANAKCTKSDLYNAWKKWCERNGKREPGISSIFGRNLSAAFPNLKDAKVTSDGTRKNGYSGIALLGEWEDDNDQQDSEDEEYIQNIQDMMPSATPEVSGVSGMCPGSTIIKHNSERATFQPLLPLVSGVSGMSGIKHSPGSQAREMNLHASHGSDTSIPDIPDTPDTTESDVDWLYVSRRLDMHYLPASTLPVCEVGGVLYYRMSPEVLNFVEHCGNRLFATTPPLPADQLQAFTEAKVRIDRFCESKWTISQMHEACARPPLDLDDIYPSQDRTRGP